MIGILRSRGESTPDALAFLYLIDGEEEGPRLTYAALDQRARAIAAVLRDGAEPGDRAVLLYEPGVEFIPAFFGCWYAGLVPVPAVPPSRTRARRNWQTVGNIVADCEPRFILTTADVQASLANEFHCQARGDGAQSIATDQIDVSNAGRWREPRIELDSLALLQYTSGSTAAPKGVMVTHANLVHNQSLLQSALHHHEPGRGVCWLPFHHDMGLVGFVLQTVFRGGMSVILSPAVLVQRPIRWLQAISRYRAHISGGPNFAYRLCAERVAAEQKAGLDLSEWTIAVVGAEPVSALTLARFAESFNSCGFRPEAFYPCYGLAEATLLVTGATKGTPPVVHCVRADALEQGRAAAASANDAKNRAIVGCGRSWAGQEVAIVHPEHRTRCPDRTVGEIWVRGPSVARGYWNRLDETESTFRAFLSDSGEGPFLRTGDLGFMEQGELFVTGRLKDVLVIHGRNHYPQDIEATVQAVHPALRLGAGAAFEIRGDGAARLVIVQELDRHARNLDLAALVGDIRQAVAARHELRVDDIQFLEPGALPRTSSGKVQRHACRSQYELGSLRRWRGK